MERVALLDFDNVIYRGHSVFDIIQSQERDGYMQPVVWRPVSEQLERYKKQEATYKEAADKMLDAWAKGLRGKSYQSAVDNVQGFFDSNPDKFFGWFEQIKPSLSKQYDIFIISTNYQFIAEAVVSRFGLSGHISSEAEVEDGVFTGRVQKSLAGNKGEVVTLLESYPREGSIGVGDSENDTEMLERVETPICFRPDEKLSAIARKRDWKVVDEDSVLEVFQDILRQDG